MSPQGGWRLSSRGAGIGNDPGVCCFRPVLSSASPAAALFCRVAGIADADRAFFLRRGEPTWPANHQNPAKFLPIRRSIFPCLRRPTPIRAPRPIRSFRICRAERQDERRRAIRLIPKCQRKLASREKGEPLLSHEMPACAGMPGIEDRPLISRLSPGGRVSVRPAGSAGAPPR